MDTREFTRRNFLKWAGAGSVALGASSFLGNVLARGQSATLNFFTVKDPFYFSLVPLIPEFEEATGIKVNLQGRSTMEIHAELVSSFVAKQKGLDLVSIDLSPLGQYADNAWIAPLTDYIERDSEEVKPEEFIPAQMWSHGEWRGEIYSMPIASYCQPVYYRKDIFDELGLKPPPQQPEDWWTWSKYMEYVRRIDEEEGYHGSVVCGAAPRPIVHMFTQLSGSKGGRYFKQFPEAPWDFTPMVNGQANLDALKFYEELYQHSPDEAINYVWFDAGTSFATQDIGMYYWWSAYAYLMRRAGYMAEEKSPNFGKIGYGVLPHEPGQDQLYTGGGWTVSIPRYSENKEEAWEFIKWMSSTETQKKMGLSEPQLFSDFVRAPLYEDPELIEVYPWLPITGEMKHNLVSKKPFPPVPVAMTLEGLYGTELNNTLAGQKTAEQALDDLQKQFETVLTQNFYIPEYRAGKQYDDTLENTKKLLERLSS